jgi:nicotinate-nucleotide adenylyltransferase
MAPVSPGLRVGLFGGAFDPPHRAHRALAEAAVSQLRLDRLHLLPTGQAWHKTRPLSDAHHRLAMCTLAFGDLPGVLVDDRETRRKGPTYTVDTLDEMAQADPGARLFLLIGADQLAAFTTWQRWTDVLRKATLVVADRHMPVADSGRSGMPAEPAVPHLSLHTPLMPISATEIRQVCASGDAHQQRLAQLVPEAVARYISQHSLYQKPS